MIKGIFSFGVWGPKAMLAEQLPEHNDIVCDKMMMITCYEVIALFFYIDIKQNRKAWKHFCCGIGCWLLAYPAMTEMLSAILGTCLLQSAG